jgi:hypothetical protein
MCPGLSFGELIWISLVRRPLTCPVWHRRRLVFDHHHQDFLFENEPCYARKVFAYLIRLDVARKTKLRT